MSNVKWYPEPRGIQGENVKCKMANVKSQKSKIRERVKTKTKVLSEISRDIGQVFFASVVIAPLMIRERVKDWLLIGLGIMGSLIFWWLSLLFVEKER